MNNKTTKNLANIKLQAAEWQAKLSSGKVSAEQNQVFQQWLKDPECELAYSQCLVILEMTTNLALDDDIQRELQAARNSVSEPQAGNDHWYATPRRLMQVAAVFMLAIGVTLALDYNSYQRYSTEVGEQRLVRLEDGSSILLNTDTQLKVRYSKQKRRVELNQGEAYFTVAKNSTRPFEVYAGSSVARALGTQFSVALLAQEQAHEQQKQVSVAVTEGLVEVEAKTKLHSQDVIAQLGVGDAINFNDATLQKIPALARADIARIQAWQQRKIYFNADTLLDAVTEYNRYSSIKFHIIDRELGDERISGLFNVGDIDAFNYSLETLLDIDIVKNNERIFLIKKGNTKL